MAADRADAGFRIDALPGADAAELQRRLCSCVLRRRVFSTPFGLVVAVGNFAGHGHPVEPVLLSRPGREPLHGGQLRSLRHSHLVGSVALAKSVLAEAGFGRVAGSGGILLRD